MDRIEFLKDGLFRLLISSYETNTRGCRGYKQSFMFNFEATGQEYKKVMLSAVGRANKYIKLHFGVSQVFEIMKDKPKEETEIKLQKPIKTKVV